MATAVKIKAEAGGPSYSSLWLLYFLLTIGLIGLFFAYLFATPLFLLGRVFPSLKAVGDRTLGCGIFLLMNVQPWMRADIDLTALQATSGEARLLVSNHRSHLDAFLLLSRVPGVRILAKSSLFSIPFLGLMMRLTEQIPVKRGRMDAFFAAMDAVRDRLRERQTVHIFPEMTRCAPGFQGTLNFSSAPFAVALEARVPVIPIVFRDTDQAWPKGTFGLSFRQPIAMRALTAIDSREFSSAADLRNEVQRRIDEALR